jgi:hypothetical protein
MCQECIVCGHGSKLEVQGEPVCASCADTGFIGLPLSLAAVSSRQGSGKKPELPHAVELLTNGICHHKVLAHFLECCRNR